MFANIPSNSVKYSGKFVFILFANFKHFIHAIYALRHP